MSGDLKDIRVCTEVNVPDDKFIEAARRAIQENPLNAPMSGGPAGGFGGRAGMALVTAKRWKPGRELRVAFLDGDAAVKRKVEQYAKQWEEFANIKLNFVNGNSDSDMRISFRHSGSWSSLGTDALVAGPAEATMNYGWLTTSSPDHEYSRVVLHEFGHALAAIHEHQHPGVAIPWDSEKVYEYYSLTQGWSKQQVDWNIFHKFSQSSTNSSDYDPHSIMHYSIPNELTVGDWEVGWNRVLSEMDKEFIATMYPHAEKQYVELVLGETHEAAIGKHGEEDLYRFKVESGAPMRHTIETGGHTDVLMALYGPDDRTSLIAEDDDSGLYLNARIVKWLQGGEYFVRVRHYRPTGTGRYTIGVSSSG